MAQFVNVKGVFHRVGSQERKGSLMTTTITCTTQQVMGKVVEESEAKKGNVCACCLASDRPVSFELKRFTEKSRVMAGRSKSSIVSS